MQVIQQRGQAQHVGVAEVSRTRRVPRRCVAQPFAGESRLRLVQLQRLDPLRRLILATGQFGQTDTRPSQAEVGL